MNNPRIRGLVYFVVFLAVAGFLCGYIPFVLMPNAGAAVGLPVITVPAEIVAPGAFFGLDLTNTIIATIVTDLLLLLFAGLAWRASKGWTNEIPGRFQGWVEFLHDTLYNFLANIGGTRLRTAPLLWPLAATLFVFLLTANLMKLLPGVETIGTMHCAYAGTAGYARQLGWTDGSSRLYVGSPLNAGYAATEETYANCNAFKNGYAAAGSSEDAATDGGVAPATPNEAVAPTTEAARGTTVLTAAEPPAAPPGVEEGAPVGQDTTELAPTDEQLIAYARAHGYPNADVPVSREAIDSGQVQPYVFAITPFLRGPATDLSLAFALALISVIAAQAYGIYANGPAYFEKFINLTALGKANKRPLGVVDFVVGLFEIISEFGKIISLAFRLFGNLFAGSIVLMVMALLVAMIIPGVFFGLEIIIGTVQALVFAVLTVVYAVQAMEAHHGDDHGDDHGHHDEGHAHA